MDVLLLGPSIAALGELCTEANYVLNGERVQVRVLIEADVKGNCVTIAVQIAQSTWQAVKGIVSDGDIETAKALIEWIGLAGGAGGLLKFLARKKGNDVESVRRVNTGGGNYYEIKIVGDGNVITLPEPLYKLAQNPKAVAAAKVLIEPVSDENGISEATFYQESGEPVKIDTKEAASIRSSTPIEDVKEEVFTAHLTVYAPVLDAKARLWRFLINGDHSSHPYIDITSTTIASDTLGRGGVRTGDCYTAEIKKTTHPRKDPEYKIIRVIEFRPGQNTDQGRFL